jgi:hypothetical protein
VGRAWWERRPRVRAVGGREGGQLGEHGGVVAWVGALSWRSRDAVVGGEVVPGVTGCAGKLCRGALGGAVAQDPIDAGHAGRGAVGADAYKNENVLMSDINNAIFTFFCLQKCHMFTAAAERNMITLIAIF